MQRYGLHEVFTSLCLKEDDIVALMTAYFDDSGTHAESDVAVAACLVSDIRRWTNFEVEWKLILEEAGILQTGFHMTDFVAHKPPFNGWTEEKRGQVIKSLVSTINKNALVGMATAVAKKDYDEIITGSLRQKLGGFHYTFAVESCLAYIEEWMKRSSLVQPVHYVFDIMGKGKHEIINLLDDMFAHNLGIPFGIEPSGYSFESKKVAVQLQASDILAWEANKYMRDHQFTGKAPRKSFKSMVDGLPDKVRARFFDESSLPGFALELTEKYQALNWKGVLGGFL